MAIIHRVAVIRFELVSRIHVHAEDRQNFIILASNTINHTESNCTAVVLLVSWNGVHCVLVPDCSMSFMKKWSLSSSRICSCLKHASLFRFTGEWCTTSYGLDEDSPLKMGLYTRQQCTCVAGKVLVNNFPTMFPHRLSVYGQGCKNVPMFTFKRAWLSSWVIGGQIKDWLIDRLTDWLIDWLVNWLIDWLVHWSVSRSVGRLVGWLIERYLRLSFGFLLWLPDLAGGILSLLSQSVLDGFGRFTTFPF